MNTLFDPAPDDEDPDMRRFLDEPVLYDGHLVARSTAYQLCLNEHQSWSSMERVTALPRAIVSPGKRVIGAAMAFTQAALRDQYKHMTLNPGRDV